MEIDKLSEILRSYTDKLKYNSGFASYKRNYVSNEYVNIKGKEAKVYVDFTETDEGKEYANIYGYDEL